MFEICVENEVIDNKNPLIIKEDINNIIQSIEEQLYNIDINYRPHIRKIKNHLKLLNGISESNLIILEDENITDTNLLSYLTHVLEISLDCIISNLYEDKDTRQLLENVKYINDLVKIESDNIKVFKNILNECENLFDVYSEINEIEISSTNFYELLDVAVTNSVNSKRTQLPSDLTQELQIYKKVINNLDNFVEDDLVNTYNNIKLFSSFQINESIIGTIATGMVGVVVGYFLIHVVSIIKEFIDFHKVFGKDHKKYMESFKKIKDLETSINNLKSDIIASFPELSIQFKYIDSEVAKCKKNATSKDEFIVFYECNMRFFMATYAVIMYVTLLQLQKEGTSLNKFNKLSDIHGFNGFASLSSRDLVKRLNLIYNKLVDYESTLIEPLDKIFQVAKQQIIENKNNDNISRHIPQPFNKQTTMSLVPTTEVRNKKQFVRF